MSRTKSPKKNIIVWSCIAPVLIFIIIFQIYPAIQGIAVSFFKWDGISEWKFTGLGNYIKMFTSDEYFWPTFKNTFYFTILNAFGVVFTGCFFAILVDFGLKFWKAFRFIFFLPFVISGFAISLLFKNALQPNGGLHILLDYLHLGIIGDAWLRNPLATITIVVLIQIWHFSSFSFIFLLAALGNIDAEIYEAARVDGANIFQRIFRISLPLIKNTIGILLVLSMIHGFRSFDAIFIMTGGRPMGLSNVMGTQLYYESFQFMNFGYASVYAVVMLIFSLLIGISYIKVSGYRREQ